MDEPKELDSNSNNVEDIAVDEEFENIVSASSSYQSMEDDIENLKVMFHSTKSVYRLNEPIDIRFYAFNNAYQMEDGDRVGIAELKKTPFFSQKVSNAMSDSCIDIISDDLIEENQITAKKMIFNIDRLPDEIRGGKFLQFCYLNNDAQVVGLSIPFKLNDHNEDEVVIIEDEQPTNNNSRDGSLVMEIEVDKSTNHDDVHMERQEDDDFIVVRTHENFLKERVDHLTRSNNLIQSLVRSLQNELSMKFIENKNLLEDREKLASELAAHKADMKKIVEQNEAEMDSLNKNLAYLRDDNRELRAELEQKTSSLEEFSRNLKEKDSVITRLVDELDSASKVIRPDPMNVAMIESLKDSLEQQTIDFEEYKKKHDIEIKGLEDALRNSVNNLKNINQKNEIMKEQNAKREEELTLKYRKARDCYSSTLARLESAKVEFSNINNRLFYYKNKVVYLEGLLNSQKPTTEERVDAVSMDTDSQQAPTTEIIRDEIDHQLDELEREEMQRAVLVGSTTESAPSTPSVSGQQTLPKQLLVDIRPIQEDEHPLPSAPPAYTASTSTSKATMKKKREDEILLVDLPCVFCNDIIKCSQHSDGSGQMREMIDHLELIHKQKMCPVCSTLFDMTLPAFRSYFSSHVQNHLTNVTYPKLSH